MRVLCLTIILLGGVPPLWARAPVTTLGPVGLERVPPQVSERAWRQYQHQAQRTAPETTEAPTVAPVPEKTPVPVESVTPLPPTPDPTSATTPVTVPQHLPTFAGQLVRVTADAVVIREPTSGEQKTLQRASVVIKDLVVGDNVTVQFAPDREALVTIQKSPLPQ